MAESAVDTVRRARAHVGGWLDAAPEHLTLHDPADARRPVAVAPRLGVDEVERALALAAVAAPEWGGTSALERGAILDRAAGLIAERAEPIAEAMTLEVGKLIAESRLEVARTVEILRFFAQAPKLQDGATFPLGSARESAFTLRLPLGVVGLITPWNFPLMIPAWKAAAALAFGNAVLLKPAEIAPLSALALVEALLDAGLPPAVLGLLPGPGSLIGPALVESERVAAISFTGSTVVGSAIAARAAATGKRVQCEMGGRNAIVVLADADLDAAAAGILGAGFGASGQRCTSSSRVIVERRVAAPLTERLTAAVAELSLGPGLDPRAELGPLASAAQLEDVLAALERGVAEGAQVLCGGSRVEDGALAHGHFMQPTLTTGPAAGWFAGHEIFGPVVSVFEVEDLDAALRLNNSVAYGLSSAIYTGSLEAAMRFVHETDTGMVHVNRPTNGAEPHIPFGGAKESSVGPAEMGDAWQFYTRTRSAHVKW